jgi:hypothetical protein
MRTNFAAREDGFRFANAFDLRPRRAMPLLKNLTPGRMVIGLCGGMCYAALDYQRSGQAVPRFEAVDALTPQLTGYLYRRQIESMRPLVLMRLADWLLRDDEYVGRKTCELELVRMRSLLNAGLPAVLCLVRTRGLADPTRNHQVIATGYEETLSGVLRIKLYDPNYPGQETELYVPEQWRADAQIAHSTGEKARGFFVLPYRPAKPPTNHTADGAAPRA